MALILLESVDALIKETVLTEYLLLEEASSTGVNVAESIAFSEGSVSSAGVNVTDLITLSEGSDVDVLATPIELVPGQTSSALTQLRRR